MTPLGSAIRGAALILALGAMPSLAGDWTPDPSRRFSLQIEGECSKATDSHRQWAEQLVAKFRTRGPFPVHSSEVAPACPSARVELNGAPSGGHRIFRHGEARRYLIASVSDPRRESFMVDLDKKYILEIGGIHTTTVHPHPSGSFAVIVYSHRAIIYGIPVAGGDENPIFRPGGAGWH